MATESIAAEVAEQEFVRFVEAMALDLDKEHMDDEDKKQFTAHRREFVRAVQRRQLVLNDQGEPVFTTSGGDALTFHEPKGADLMQSDARKIGHDVKKFYTVMGAMTRTSSLKFEQMPNRDLKVCQAIAILFLA
jgi:hypothetical protein